MTSLAENVSLILRHLPAPTFHSTGRNKGFNKTECSPSQNRICTKECRDVCEEEEEEDEEEEDEEVEEERSVAQGES